MYHVPKYFVYVFYHELKMFRCQIQTVNAALHFRIYLVLQCRVVITGQLLRMHVAIVQLVVV